jgi:HEAT repeat protein
VPLSYRRWAQKLEEHIRNRWPHLFDLALVHVLYGVLGGLAAYALYFFRHDLAPSATRAWHILETYLSAHPTPVVVAETLAVVLVFLIAIASWRWRHHRLVRGLDFIGPEHAELLAEANRIFEIDGFSVTDNTSLGPHVTVATRGRETIAIWCEPRADFVLTSAHARELLSRLHRNKIHRGVFICRSALGRGRYQLNSRGCLLEVASYGDLALHSIDFGPYLKHLILEWENGVDHGQYIAPSGTDEQGMAHRSLDDYFEQRFGVPGQGGCILLLGDFGTGKTTFLRHFAYRTAKEHFQESMSAGIPIFINLKDFEVDGNLAATVVRTLKRSGVTIEPDLLVDSQLTNKIVLILDGFDEMSLDPSRNTTQKNVQRVLDLARTPQRRLVLSCRTHFFRDSLEERQFQTFASMHLERWGESEIESFVQKAIGEDWRVALDQVSRTYDLKGLAQTPLFLKMILETRDQLGSGPVHSAMLYARYTNKWIESQDSRAALDADQKASFMAQLAWKMRIEDRFSIPRIELRDTIRNHYSLPMTDVYRFELDVVACSFLKRAGEDYTFVHTSFLEYFIARHLADLPSDVCMVELSKVSLGSVVADFLAQMLDRLSWYETLHHWLEESSSREHALLRRNVAVVLRAMSKSGFTEPEANRHRQVQEATDVLLSTSEIEEKWRAIVKLGWLRLPSTSSSIRNILNDGSQEKRIIRIAELVLGLYGDAANIPVFTELLEKSPEAIIRQNAAVALGLMSDVAATALPVLVRSVRNERESQVRRSVIWAIEMIDPATARSTLSESALSDKNLEVRQYAVLALGRLGGDQAFDVLKQAMHDRSALVRVAAITSASELGGATAMEIAQSGLHDKNRDVSDVAKRAVIVLTDKMRPKVDATIRTAEPNRIF